MPWPAAIASSSSIHRPVPSAPCSRARAEGVQAVRLDPEVRVGEPTAERGRVGEQLQRAGDVAPPGGDEPEAHPSQSEH